MQSCIEINQVDVYALTTLNNNGYAMPPIYWALCQHVDLDSFACLSRDKDACFSIPLEYRVTDTDCEWMRQHDWHINSLLRTSTQNVTCQLNTKLCSALSAQKRRDMIGRVFRRAFPWFFKPQPIPLLALPYLPSNETNPKLYKHNEAFMSTSKEKVTTPTQTPNTLLTSRTILTVYSSLAVALVKPLSTGI